MKEERAEFKNSKGQKLVGIISKPDGEGPFPAVISCHGFTGSKDRNYRPKLAKLLAENGFIDFRFDFTGNGESEGEFSDGTPTQEISDVTKAIDLIESFDFVDKNRIGLVGHSMGGGIVVGAASIDKRIKILVALSPSSRYFVKDSIRRCGEVGTKEIQEKGFTIYDKGKGRVFKITKEFIDDRIKHNFLEEVKNVKCPILIIHGDKDKSVPFEDGKRLFENANEPKKFFHLKGGDHCYYEENFEEVVISKTVDFFKKFLGDKR